MTTETKGDIIKSYTYDDLSRRTAFNVADGEENVLNQTYSYDVMGRLVGTSSGEDTVSYTYDANSNLLSKAYNGNVYHTAMYNKANMPVVTQLYNEGVLADTTHYTYNLDGNLAMTTGSKVSSQYYYDYGNRLVHESTWGDGIDYSDDYDYDFRGNRTKRVHKDKLTDATETTDYTYNIINQLTTQTNGTDTVNYNYDTVGNMTSVAKNGTTEKSYTYDAFNRLATANVNGTASSYTYNGDNLRQSKTVNGVTTNHIYDGANIVADQNSDTTVFVRGMGLALLKNGTTTQVYGITPRGDVAKLMSANGDVADYTYTAYGEPTTPNTNIHNPFGYTGEYTDAETGLVYLRNRYYDPEIGRFLTEDTYWNVNNMIYGDKKFEDGETKIPDVNAIKQSNNLFAYCGNNPVNFIDYTGNEYSNSVKEKDGYYEVTTTIDIWWTELEYVYKIVDGAVIFSFSENSYGSAFWFGCSYELAQAIYDSAKSLSADYLSWRTVSGIDTELKIHWAAYCANFLPDKASPANIGGTNPNKPGYDSNAWFFQTIRAIEIATKIITNNSSGRNDLFEEIGDYLK